MLFRSTFLLALLWSSAALAFAQGIDIRVLRSLNPDQPTAADKPLLFVTNTMKPVCIAMPIGMVAVGLLTKDPAMTQAGISNGLSFATTIGATYALKNTVKRPRPYVTYPDLRNMSEEDSWSFPSGHSSGAFSMATALTLSYPKWYIAVPAYAWAGTVAYSRMHLGVHYPSDVLVGSATGVGFAFLSHYLTKKLWAAYGPQKSAKR